MKRWTRTQKQTTVTDPTVPEVVNFTDEFTETSPVPEAQYVATSGEMAVMPNGQVLTMGANGEVYRDGEQLAGVAARKIVQFGTSIYAQGKTVPSWWRWNGTGWTAVPNFDPMILK